jgi:hypothetical protein
MTLLCGEQKMKTILLSLLACSIAACSPSEKPDAPLTSDANQVAVMQFTSNDSVNELDHARGVVLRAELAEYEKLTPAQRARNDSILSRLKADHLRVVTVGLPTWVKEQLMDFESGGSVDFGEAYSRSVAWGTGQYNGRGFLWFAHTNSDAWLQVDLSIRLDSADVIQVTGARFSDGVFITDSEAKLEIDLPSPGNNTWAYGKALTHIGMKNSVDWMEEFCTAPDRWHCDTASAFEKYLLAEVNHSLPGKLALTMSGRFPE